MARNLAVLLLTGILLCTSSVQAAGDANSSARTQLLWPAGAPGAKAAGEKDKPAMTIYLPPKEKATGAAVVVIPGGGYWAVAIDHEGHQVARWLNSIGIAGFVVDYRNRGKGYGHPAPIQDAQRAIRTVRGRAAEFGVEPNKIGVLGFSAGGHLASTAGTHFAEKFYEPNDVIDEASARPDFMILIYPVITLSESFSHAGSREALLGKNAPLEMFEKFSNDRQVTPQTPPAFLVHTSQDKAVPVENSILFYRACIKAGVPAEMHIFEKGEHGFGLGKPGQAAAAWPDLAATWMTQMGLCGK